MIVTPNGSHVRLADYSDQSDTKEAFRASFDFRRPRIWYSHGLGEVPSPCWDSAEAVPKAGYCAKSKSFRLRAWVPGEVAVVIGTIPCRSTHS